MKMQDRIPRCQRSWKSISHDEETLGAGHALVSGIVVLYGKPRQRLDLATANKGGRECMYGVRSTSSDVSRSRQELTGLRDRWPLEVAGWVSRVCERKAWERESDWLGLSWLVLACLSLSLPVGILLYDCIGK